MFGNQELKDRIKYLESVVEKLDIDEYLDWKHMKDANQEAAAKQGYFFLSSKADTQLLEKVISEINNNEDLTALFKTADGATLSLRVHKQPQINQNLAMRKFNSDE